MSVRYITLLNVIYVIYIWNIVKLGKLKLWDSLKISNINWKQILVGKKIDGFNGFWTQVLPSNRYNSRLVCADHKLRRPLKLSSR